MDYRNRLQSGLVRSLAATTLAFMCSHVMSMALTEADSLLKRGLAEATCAPYDGAALLITLDQNSTQTLALNANESLSPAAIKEWPMSSTSKPGGAAARLCSKTELKVIDRHSYPVCSEATTGTFTIISVGAESATGSFDLGFTKGEQIRGSFEAKIYRPKKNFQQNRGFCG